MVWDRTYLLFEKVNCCIRNTIRTSKFWTFKDSNMCSISVRREWNCSLPFVSSISDCSSALPSPTSSPFSNGHLLPVSLMPPCLPPVVLLYFSRLKIYFIFCVCFFMYYLCKKYCKPVTVQYCVVDCVSWVPRLTLLDLGTNWTHKCALRTEFICIWGTYCTA